MQSTPSIRYAGTSDGVDIAYWKLGRGPVLLHSPNVQLGHARAEWSIEGMRRWYESLARHFTVVRYDHRGGGLSSRADGAQTIDALVRDIDAVVERVSTEPVILLGLLSGGLPAIAWAAGNPSRTAHLVLWSSFARDATHGQAPRLRSLFQMAATDWELFTESISQAALGWRNADEARLWAKVTRAATTQDEFLAFLKARRAWDVEEYLGRVRAPTLVFHDRENPLASERRTRELAAGIPRARLVVCESADGTPGDEALAAILELAGLGEGMAAGLDQLTPREREVLHLVVEGAKNREIAERLFISVHTVTRHLTHIYAKLGVAGRAQAVRRALEQGLLDS
ncbi:MAG: alpha/beta fold hydrolase [Gemmatimonadota bacterium]|jgi:DNA-binding CsgD family transcriptional regulator/pimeloyl-ACP methyl ester carboxylesterase